MLSLTGLDVQENQARRLLNDVLGHKAWLEDNEGLPIAQSVAALRWLAEVFEPSIAAVPADLTGKLESAELFHQILEHRWYLSEQRGEADRDGGRGAGLRGHRPAPASRRAQCADPEAGQPDLNPRRAATVATCV